MSEVLKVIETRRSVRKNQNKDVPKELIEQVAKAGTYLWSTCCVHCSGR